MKMPFSSLLQNYKTMDTKNFHLTEMAQLLQKDTTGVYRQSLIETLLKFQQAFNQQPNDIQTSYKELIQAFVCAKTILVTED